jgi:hypothetical protein
MRRIRREWLLTMKTPDQIKEEIAAKLAAKLARRAAPPSAAAAPLGRGPGTELRKMLASIGIHPRGEKCRCNQHAHEMDVRGADWCEENLESIIDWLEAEAKTRGLIGALFTRTAARMAVKKAIARSRAPKSVGAP